MDRWPTDDRQRCQAILDYKDKDKDKGKKVKDKDRSWTYPVVEHGSLSAAILERTGDHLRWMILAGNPASRRLVPTGNPMQIFPELRQNSSHWAARSVLQLAEQGAQFLRTYYPDIDVPAEIIRDEITQDVRYLRALKEFDPYAGSMVATFSCARGARGDSSCLALARGESFRELNISPIPLQKQGSGQLDPVPKPVHTFRTPIQQIVSQVSSSATPSSSEPLLGVRTLASMVLLKVKLTPSRLPAASTEEVAQILRSDVGDRRIVDMVLPSLQDVPSLLVNDAGAVYKCSLRQEEKSLQLLYPPPPVPTERDDRLWRIAPWTHEASCLLMSSQSTTLLDSRTQNISSNIYRTSTPGEVLTSIEGVGEDRMIRLVTTQEILWVDERNTRKPLLGIRHRRAFDRTLASHTRFISNVPVTFLTSCRNGLTSIFDVSRSEEGLLRSNGQPYSLPAIQSPSDRSLGKLFFAERSTPEVSLLQLSVGGGVYMSNFRLSHDESCPPVAIKQQVETHFSPRLQAMGEQSHIDMADVGPLGARTFNEVDIRPIYDRLFYEGPDFKRSENPEALYDLLDQFPSFWQQLDVPLENMVTTYDIAYHAGGEPFNNSRNDILNESILNCKRGYRVLMQGRIPISQLAQRAPWHINITPFLHRFVSDIEVDKKETFENLHRYDLSSDHDRPASSYGKEREACEQLLLDISLSSDIFSPQRFQKLLDPDLDNAFETMSRATEAMSLDEPLPVPIQFGFLRPLPRGSVDYYPNLRKESSPETEAMVQFISPLGARLLLKEWEVGSDPKSYLYDDPYNPHGDQSSIKRRRYREQERPRNVAAPGPEAITESQRPPPVVPAATLAPPMVVTSQPLVPRIPAVHSQDAPVMQGPLITNNRSQPMEYQNDLYSSSQPPMPQTQVLPGPHGGRPGPAKKKIVRKRIGGF